MPSYRCPKCSTVITAEPNAQGIVACTCGVKLRTRPAAPPPSAPAAGPPPPASSPPPPAPPPPVAPATAATIDTLLEEIRAVRAVQEQILERLQSWPAAGAPPSAAPSFGFGVNDDDDEAPPSAPAPTPMRARRRKTVLLIDDQAPAREAATAALQTADVPVRAVGEGNAALAAIAQEKPDVIVIELAMGGEMAGKDVINMIKATMEWVDIPIVLYTHMAMGGQKEARTIHGADELVSKSEGPAALVARVISIFRR